jgi:hypothetical protein
VRLSPTDDFDLRAHKGARLNLGIPLPPVEP